MVLAGIFSLRRRVQTGSGAHPASYAMGTRDLITWVKRPGREADDSPTFTSRIKMYGNLILSPSSSS
jgi:hypothetical protein